MRTILILLMLLSGSIAMAINDSTGVYRGFSGGMFLHTGYLFGQDSHAPRDVNGVLCSPQGVTFGIGGTIRIHLMDHLRVGGEGFVSTMNSGMTDCRDRLQSGSYIRQGWGGVLADACWRLHTIWPYVGSSFGGGVVRALYILEGDETDWREEPHAIFHKQSFFYVSTYTGFDWCMSDKVHLTFRLDWLVALHDREVVIPTGPRVHIGFMFCH